MSTEENSYATAKDVTDYVKGQLPIELRFEDLSKEEQQKWIKYAREYLDSKYIWI